MACFPVPASRESVEGSGWTKELNLVSWNNRDPKYDLRDRSADHEKMSNPAGHHGGAWGVTLSKEDLQALKALLSKVDLEQH